VGANGVVVWFAHTNCHRRMVQRRESSIRRKKVEKCPRGEPRVDGDVAGQFEPGGGLVVAS